MFVREIFIEPSLLVKSCTRTELLENYHMTFLINIHICSKLIFRGIKRSWFIEFSETRLHVSGETPILQGYTLTHTNLNREVALPHKDTAHYSTWYKERYTL